MEISLISYRGLAHYAHIVTHQRVMSVIMTDNHFDENTRGESRELHVAARARAQRRLREKNEILFLKARLVIV